MENEKVEEVKEPTSQPTDNGTGNQPKAFTAIEQANQAAERMESANKQALEILERNEILAAERALGGTSEASIPTPTAEPISDIEFAEKVQRGEINPFKEDGII